MLLALLVGVLYIAPQIIIKMRVEGLGHKFILFQFIELADGGDAYFQFAREIYEGHFPPGDLFSDKNLPNIYPWLPPLFFGFLIKILKDINLAYIAANFIFPALFFTLFYFLGQVIFKKNKLWSLFLALVAVLTPMPLLADRMFFSFKLFGDIFLKNFYPEVKTILPTLYFSRADYPLLTHIFYLPAIITLFIFWRRPGFKTAMLAGFTGGLLAYVYFHKWVYWMVVLGFLFLLSIFFLKKETKRLQLFLVLGFTTILTSIPYFINYFRLASFNGSKDLIQRLSLEVGRSVNLSVWPQYIIYFSLAVLVYLIYFKKDLPLTILYWSFLLAAFFVWNIQVIIGFVPHSDHWPRAINPLIFLVIFDLAYNLVQRIIKRVPTLNRVFIFSMVLLMVLLVFKKTINAVKFLEVPNDQIISNYTLPESVLDSYSWIEKNYSEPIVISPSFISSIYLSAFTSSRPFLPWGGVSPMSNYSLEELFLKSNKNFYIPKNIFTERLEKNGLPCTKKCNLLYVNANFKDTRLYLYQLYFMDKNNTQNRDIPAYKIEELSQRYDKLETSWKKTGADLVYLGPWENIFNGSILKNDKDLSLVYSNKEVEIYKIIK